MLTKFNLKILIISNIKVFRQKLALTNGVRRYLNRLTYSNRRKKDVATAILDKKKAPHKLTVEEAKNDDNSVVEMS